MISWCFVLQKKRSFFVPVLGFFPKKQQNNNPSEAIDSAVLRPPWCENGDGTTTTTNRGGPVMRDRNGPVVTTAVPLLAMRCWTWRISTCRWRFAEVTKDTKRVAAFEKLKDAATAFQNFTFCWFVFFLFGSLAFSISVGCSLSLAQETCRCQSHEWQVRWVMGKKGWQWWVCINKVGTYIRVLKSDSFLTLPPPTTTCTCTPLPPKKLLLMFIIYHYYCY